jgi:hypothetical protein
LRAGVFFFFAGYRVASRLGRLLAPALLPFGLEAAALALRFTHQPDPAPPSVLSRRVDLLLQTPEAALHAPRKLLEVRRKLFFQES